jgi:diaminopimelate decarboxylase
MINYIIAKKEPLIEEFLNQEQELFEHKKKCSGPIQIIFSEILENNIKELKSHLDSINVPFRIHFAHKPTKSKTVISEVKKQGLCIDVASPKELLSALNAGFRKQEIECTGPKTRDFIEKAVNEECLISVDSIGELNIISELAKKETHIILRISDLQCNDRFYLNAESRFGIAQHLLPEAYNIIKSNKLLVLRGFHYHNVIRTSDVKVSLLKNMMQIMEDSYKEGFTPDLFNIGGDLRKPMLEDFNEWLSFLQNLEEELIKNEVKSTWRNHAYGMYINHKQRISGREKVEGMFTTENYKNTLSEVLLDSNLAKRITENMWVLLLEPGWLLLQNVGITLVEVIGIKETSSKQKLIIVNANRTNFSTGMKEIFCDPILISKDKNKDSFSGFIVGNLCEEKDFIMKRRVFFNSEPKEGDILCFMNTAGYISDFEDASPIQQPTVKKFTASKNENIWSIKEE